MHRLKEGERVYHFELLERERFAEQRQCGVLEISGHCTLFVAVFKVEPPSLTTPSWRVCDCAC